MKIRIYRGLPGSGKNTHAESSGFDTILDSDAYHVNEDGEYDFDPDNLEAAHAWCFREFLAACSVGVSRIAVCNTNTTRAEYMPYVMAARAFGRGDQVKLVHMLCSVETSFDRNTHSVPEHVIEGMYERWEEPKSYDPEELTICTD